MMSMRISILLALLFGLSCGDATEGHILRIRADDGSVGGNIIIQNAVHEIEILVIPDLSNGRFEAMEPRELEGGTVEMRVSAAGEWVLRLRREYIDANAYTAGTTFAIDVPLYTEQEDNPAIIDPTLNVRFYRNGERIGESNPRFLLWPPPPADDPGGQGTTDVVVRCPEMFRLQCLNND